MSGYLFNLAQGSGDVYVARGNLLVYGTNDWNMATSIGVYEVLASEYASYINAGPLVQNGLLQVNRCGLRCTQIVSYSNGVVYSRSAENVLTGAWTAWIMLSNTGSYVPVGSVPVGSVPVGSVPVGSVPVGGPTPVGSVPVGSGFIPRVSWTPELVANGDNTVLRITHAQPGAIVEYNSTSYDASGQIVATRPRTFGGTLDVLGEITLSIQAIWGGANEVSAQNHVFIGGLGEARVLFIRAQSQTPVGSVPVGSVPVGSVPVGSVPVYNEAFTTPVPEVFAGTALTLNITGGKPGSNFVLTSPNNVTETFTLNSSGSFTITRVVVGVQEQSADRIVNAYSVVFSETGHSRYLSYISVKSPQYVPPVGSVPVGSVPVGSVPVGFVPVGGPIG